ESVVGSAAEATRTPAIPHVATSDAIRMRRSYAFSIRSVPVTHANAALTRLPCRCPAEVNPQPVRNIAALPKSPAVERWFANTQPPSEAAMRRVRDIILGSDPSMRERPQYGITFSSTKTGDFAAFVRYREPGVNLRLHRGGRLVGRYP